MSDATGIVIAHLYPRELGINGDVGNVRVLRRRAAARGIDVRVIDVGRGDALPAETDLVHVGAGPLSAIETVHADAMRHADALVRLRDAGSPILAISGGWQLLGRSITTEDGRELAGLGVFPTRAQRGALQAADETVLSTPTGTVAGYVNHNAVTTLEDGAEPLGRVVAGYGNLAGGTSSTGLEGVVVGASIGTALHGTVLALNPAIADAMLSAAVRASAMRRGADGTEAEAAAAHATRRPSGDDGAWLDRVDEFARRAREAIIGRTGASVTA